MFYQKTLAVEEEVGHLSWVNDNFYQSMRPLYHSTPDLHRLEGNLHLSKAIKKPGKLDR